MTPQRAKVRRFWRLRNGIVLRPAERAAHARRRQETGVEQAGHIGRRHRPVGDAARRRLHFDQRLEPEQRRASRCARARRQGRAARPRASDGGRDLSAPTRQGRGIARNDRSRTSSCRAPRGQLRVEPALVERATARRRASPRATGAVAEAVDGLERQPAVGRRARRSRSRGRSRSRCGSARRPSPGRLRRGRAEHVAAGGASRKS